VRGHFLHQYGWEFFGRVHISILCRPSPIFEHSFG
jgi:hypothetical protein